MNFIDLGVQKEIETGEFYFGSRTSKLHPTNDCYFGSMKVWKPNKKNLKKIILKEEFNNREDAIEYEKLIIKQFINDPLNRNYNIPHTNFYVHQELFNYKGHQQGEKNSQYGTRWIYNTNGVAKKIKKDGIILRGWYPGRTSTSKPYSPGKGQKGENNSQFGTCWITNGIDTKKMKKNDSVPLGWKLGCVNKKMVGYRWINNGVINKKLKLNNVLPKDWFYGRLI